MFVQIVPIKMSKLSNYLKTIETKIKQRKSNKQYFYVYRISNILNNMHYYGSRTCNILPEEDLGIKYTSSSKYVNADIAQYGMCNFKFKIVKKFCNYTDMIVYESFLHDYFNVKQNDSFYNKSNAKPTGFSTSGLAVVYDKDGNIFTVDISNDKYKSGEYKLYLGSQNKGKINVVDSTGKIIKVKVDDDRILSGDVVLHTKVINERKTTVFDINKNDFIRIYKEDINREIHDFRHIKTKGMVVVTDGKKNFHVSVNDERYINGELVSCCKNTFTAKDKDGNFIKVNVDDERYINGDLYGANKNKVLVKDKNGNNFMIDKTDERYINGEVEKIFGKYERTEWECPHCGKTGKGISNANRWHFEKCQLIRV